MVFSCHLPFLLIVLMKQKCKRGPVMASLSLGSAGAGAGVLFVCRSAWTPLIPPLVLASLATAAFASLLQADAAPSPWLWVLIGGLSVEELLFFLLKNESIVLLGRFAMTRSHCANINNNA